LSQSIAIAPPEPKSHFEDTEKHTMAEVGGMSGRDVQGAVRLVRDAAVGLTDLIEHTHASILDTPGLRLVAPRVTGGVTRFVYSSVRDVMHLVGHGFDLALGEIAGRQPEKATTPEREVVLAALNGVLGDHLADRANPLALKMQFRRIEPGSKPGGRIAVLIHGLCKSDLQWTRRNHDHGVALARDFGFTPVYLSYNSGLHISTNGRALAEGLEALITQWPVPIEDLVIIGHSMGGLVARSACYYAEEADYLWRRKLNKMLFLGAPHHGAPLERIGHWVEGVVGKIPYASGFAGFAKIRSAGIRDLRYGALLDEDWSAGDAERPRIVALPEGVSCYAIAASLAAGNAGPKGRLIGDGLVTIASATGDHRDPARDLRIPADRRWVGVGMGHFDLLSRPEVYEQIARWLRPES
jgi:pimeloyl-ACP methyl ester carboxylesterase